MSRLPTALLFSCDAAWEQRLRGNLWSICEIVAVEDEASLHVCLHQYADSVLFLDFYGTNAVTLLQELRKSHAERVVIGLGDARSDVGLQMNDLGVYDILEPEADRLRVQRLFAHAHQFCRLQRENDMLRAKLARVPSQSPPPMVRESLAPLNHLSHAMRRFEQLDEMLHRFVDVICHAVCIARAGFVMVGKDQSYRFAAGRNCLHTVCSRVYERSDPFVVWMQMHAHGISASMLRHVEKPQDAYLLQEALDFHGAELIFPLWGRDRLIGWLFLGRQTAGQPYLEQDITELSSMAEQISVALENAILHDRLGVQKAFAENLLETIPSGIIASSPDGRIEWFNRVAATYMKRDFADSGHTISALPIPMVDMLKRCMAGTHCVGPVEWKEPKQGRPLSIQAHRLEQKDSCIGAMLVLRDLTEQRALQEQQNNVERAAFWNELANALSHEVRNPLVAISTFAQLLPESYHDEEFRTQFRDLTTKEVARLNGIVDQLDFFANPPTLSLQSVRVETLVHAALCKEPADKVKPKPSILLDLDASLPLVHADADIFSHALSHVLDNARTAVSKVSDPQIHVRTYLQHVSGALNQVVLEVEDNGVGIPEDAGDKVYSPFYTTKTRGVGLGLAIVRRTMIDHAGTVDIDSDSKGTRVRLKLPAMEG